MLMIGKCNEVFQPSNDKVPDLLSAKTYNEFKLAKEKIQGWFKRYVKSGAPKLNITIPTELVPNPKNYIEKCNLPMKWSISAKKEILQHEFNIKNINVITCDICLELQILDKQLKQTKEPHTCQKCQNRKDPMYFLRNNLHPVESSSEIKMEIECRILKGHLSSQGWAWLKSFFFADVLIMFYQYICLMGHLP